MLIFLTFRHVLQLINTAHTVAYVYNVDLQFVQNNAVAIEQKVRP